MDQEGDEEDDPAPTSLRVIVLLQRPQLPQFLLVRRVLGPRDLAIAGDDHLDTVRLLLLLTGAGGVRLTGQDPTTCTSMSPWFEGLKGINDTF